MMRNRLLMMMAALAGACIIFTACGNENREEETHSEVITKNQESEQSQGTQTLLPLENTDFYYGTWKGLFYYDVDNDKIESMEDEEGYYITFNEKDILVANGENVLTADVTTSDGIQTNDAGSDYYCLYYNDANGNKVTLILTMMHISGESQNGVDDGDYLSVMASNNGSKYMFFEKAN